MSGPAEGRRFCGSGSQGAACQSPVMSRYAGRHGRVGGVDGDGVGRTVRVGVVDDHLGEVEGFGLR